MTTLIVCINAAGDILPPFIIHKIKFPQTQNDYPFDTYMTYSKSGYSCEEIFTDFLKHFQKHQVKIENQKSVLIVDGHLSHVSLRNIQFCDENNV